MQLFGSAVGLERQVCDSVPACEEGRKPQHSIGRDLRMVLHCWFKILLPFYNSKRKKIHCSEHTVGCILKETLCDISTMSNWTFNHSYIHIDDSNFNRRIIGLQSSENNLHRSEGDLIKSSVWLFPLGATQRQTEILWKVCVFISVLTECLDIFRLHLVSLFTQSPKASEALALSHYYWAYYCFGQQSGFLSMSSFIGWFYQPTFDFLLKILDKVNSTLIQNSR